MVFITFISISFSLIKRLISLSYNLLSYYSCSTCSRNSSYSRCAPEYFCTARFKLELNLITVDTKVGVNFISMLLELKQHHHYKTDLIDAITLDSISPYDNFPYMNYIT